MTTKLSRTNNVLELTKTYFSDKGFKEIKAMLGRIYHFNQGRKLELTKEELALEDLLTQKNLKPSTVYRWFLLENADDDVKEKLEKGFISMRMAAKLNQERNEEKTEQFRNKILVEILNFVKEVCTE